MFSIPYVTLNCWGPLHWGSVPRRIVPKLRHFHWLLKMNNLAIIHGKVQIEYDRPYTYVRVHFSGSGWLREPVSISPLNSISRMCSYRILLAHLHHNSDVNPDHKRNSSCKSNHKLNYASVCVIKKKCFIVELAVRGQPKYNCFLLACTMCDPRPRFGQVRSGSVRFGQVRSGSVRLGQARSGSPFSGTVATELITHVWSTNSAMPDQVWLFEPPLLRSRRFENL